MLKRKGEREKKNDRFQDTRNVKGKIYLKVNMKVERKLEIREE